MRKTITLEAEVEELTAWKAAANGPLSKWMRRALNAAVSAGIPSPGNVDLATIVQEAVQAALAAKGVSQVEQPTGYVPPALPPLTPGAKTVPIDPELADRNRHRGYVASFIRVRGAEWKFDGPNPCQFGCKVRPDVLAEYAPQLDQLRGEMDHLQRMGLEPGTIIT